MWIPFNMLLRHLFIFVSLLLSGSCAITNARGYCVDGVVSFEKIQGTILQSVNLIPVYSNNGKPVTAECNNRCRSSDSCLGFVVNYDLGACFRVEQNSEGRRRDLILTGDRSTYFEKICLHATGCDRAWMFETVLDYFLDGFDDMIINEVVSRQQCMELCLREKGIQCRSAEYFHDRQQCRLSEEDRRTQPTAFYQSTENVDYMENQCTGQPNSIRCEFEEYVGQDLGISDLQVTTQTLDDCERVCDQNPGFVCRSFTYFSFQGLCRLSGDDTYSAGINLLQQSLKGVYYQRTSCLDLALKCSVDTMKIILRTNRPFTGRIFSQSNPNMCEVLGGGRRETEITFSLRNSKCGVVMDSEGSYSNVVVVQHHPLIQRRGDKAIKMICMFETTNVTVTSGFNYLIERVSGAGGGVTAIVNATAPSPKIQLRIVDEHGVDVNGAKLGQVLFLRLEIDDGSIYGIFAKNLIAKSGNSIESIPLLDDHGCPTDPAIFPHLEKVPGSKSLHSKFEAFKFTDNPVVRFQVTVQFCLEECHAVRCGQQLSYGRKKRDVSNGRPQPYVYSDRDRPPWRDGIQDKIIYEETPLQRDLVIDIPTSDSQFLNSNQDAEVSYLVCTTRTAAVFVIISFVFLLLCASIVAFLYVKYHKKKYNEKFLLGTALPKSHFQEGASIRGPSSNSMSPQAFKTRETSQI